MKLKLKMFFPLSLEHQNAVVLCIILNNFFLCMTLDEFLGLISQVGVRMLETAVWGTYYNVTTNLSDLKDQEFKTQASTMQFLGNFMLHSI